MKFLFRALGAILGISFIYLAFPIGDLDRGPWSPWVVTVSLIGFGMYLLLYAATGRSTIFHRSNR